jgi:hypothetical protein
MDIGDLPKNLAALPRWIAMLILCAKREQAFISREADKLKLNKNNIWIKILKIYCVLFSSLNIFKL